MLKRLARKGLDVADNVFAALAPRVQRESGCLVTLLFHSLYGDSSQATDPRLAPSENLTVEEFRRLIGAAIDSGYTPVSPAQVDAGLAHGRNYVMITFDDGYFNNTAALDVLERFQAPATFFISTDHVLQGKGFWWDAFHRELAASGANAQARKREIERVKAWSSDRIEAHLYERYGSDVLRPRSDLDRPFSVPELQDFSRNKWVHLGNHTCNHAILTNCTPAQAEQQIQGCQDALRSLVGYAPIAIAYPNGDYREAAVNAARRCGLSIGVTVRPFANPLPLRSDKSRMTLGRFAPAGGRDMRAQWQKFSTPFVPSHMVKTLITSAY
ncbi:MAG: polysaccharide deacetylase family protein [Pseudomonadota bacterium]